MSGTNNGPNRYTNSHSFLCSELCAKLCAFFHTNQQTKLCSHSNTLTATPVACPYGCALVHQRC